jgi:hypothetical protein
MCVIKIRTHLCGRRIPYNTELPCIHRNQADLLGISLEFPGSLPVPLIQAEIKRKKALCNAEKTEEIFCKFYQGCVACAEASARLGAAEVARRLTRG